MALPMDFVPPEGFWFRFHVIMFDGYGERQRILPVTRTTLFSRLRCILPGGDLMVPIINVYSSILSVCTSRNRDTDQ